MSNEWMNRETNTIDAQDLINPVDFRVAFEKQR